MCTFINLKYSCCNQGRARADSVTSGYKIRGYDWRYKFPMRMARNKCCSIQRSVYDKYYPMEELENTAPLFLNCHKIPCIISYLMLKPWVGDENRQTIVGWDRNLILIGILKKGKKKNTFELGVRQLDFWIRKKLLDYTGRMVKRLHMRRRTYHWMKTFIFKYLLRQSHLEVQLH